MPKTEEEAAEFDYAAAAAKAPTDLHAHLAEWLVDKTGLEFGTKKELAAFEKGVQLATTLRMKHQSSPENIERREALAAANAENDSEPAAPAPVSKAKAKKAAPAPAPVEDALAPKAKRKAVKAVPTAKAPF